MLTLADIQIGDILVASNPYSNDFLVYQIVGYNKSNMPRYVQLVTLTKVSQGQIIWKILENENSKPVTFTKPWKDGFLRISGLLLERYDPTKVYSNEWQPVGSQDDSDYSSYDFEN
jgi:hypothetical protein